MHSAYQYYADLAAELTEIQADSIVSRTLHSAPNLKVILFGFAAGQELSEHTSARPAILHFVRGEATVTLGDETFAARPGSFAVMPPRLRHSITAQTEVVMLLLMLAPGEKGADGE